jgi:acetyltransferase-like isoleucine patch superfamily enzyme
MSKKKELLKLLGSYTIKLFSIIYNYETSKVFKHYKNVIYSYWISNSIKNCGNGFRIRAPVYIKGGKYMTIGENFGSLERLRLECWDTFSGLKYVPNLVIGKNVAMNFNVHIGCIDSVIIGDNVLFGSNIFITDHQHGYIDKRDLGIAPAKRFLSTNGPVEIENNVWIGENVAIMPNVTIGEGSIIGANSVVTKSFPKNSVLAGVPAKLIRSLES